MPLQDDVTAEDLAAIEKGDDLLAAASLFETYQLARRVDDAHERVPERERQLRAMYARLLAGHVGRIFAALESDTWTSKDCQTAVLIVNAAEPAFTGYAKEDYAALWEGTKPPPKELPDDLDLPEDLSGYDSADSDDELEDVEKPKEVQPTHAELVQYRKQVKRAKQKQKQRIDRGLVLPKGVVRTWRTYGVLEPEPDEIIQHVVGLRAEMGKKKDEMAPERDKREKALTEAKKKLAEKERALKELPKEAPEKRREQLQHALKRIQAQIDERQQLAGELAGKAKLLEEEFQMNNPAIRHSPLEWTAQAEKDFGRAKILFAQGNVAELGKLQTKFCLAQYRGITYNHHIFSAEQRRLSRERREVGQPVFSMSVLHAAGIRPDDYFEGRCTEDEIRTAIQVAEGLKKVLVDKRSTGEVIVNGYRYACHADAIQDIYTNYYDYIHATISTYLEHKELFASKGTNVDGTEPGEGLIAFQPVDFYAEYDAKKHGPIEEYLDRRVKEYEEHCATIEAKNKLAIIKNLYGVVPPSDWAVFDGLLNGKNPFCSTGDAPRHALKYAYGMKFYKGHEHERLRPRWREDGKVVHPYSGKVFVSLHSLEDYLGDAPNHVPSMNMSARIVIGDAIADERETTFPAYIPGERVVMEHICKYPSFHRPWRRLYLRKYGLDRDMWDEFKGAVLETDVQKTGEFRNLESWLVNFHEARLVELARRQALDRGMLLVYRDSSGALARGLTPTRVHAGSRFEDPRTRKLTSTLAARDQRRLADAVKDDRTSVTKAKKKPDAPSKSPAKKTFRERMTAANLTIHRVPPDGNCFFHALLAAAVHAAYQPVMGHDHAQFRTWLVGKYQNYPDIEAQQKITTAYKTEMTQVAARPGQVSRWGSDAEIILFCRETDSRVFVYSPRYPNDRAEFVTFGRPPLRTLHLVNSGGDHWEWAVQN